MTDQEMADLRRRYNEGMRAMSKQSLEEMARAQEAGMRNAYPDASYMAGAQNFNMWPLLLADKPPEPPKPAPLTRWQRFLQWWRK